jgi:hypothetical protein
VKPEPSQPGKMERVEHQEEHPKGSEFRKVYISKEHIPFLSGAYHIKYKV